MLTQYFRSLFVFSWLVLVFHETVNEKRDLESRLRQTAKMTT